MSRGSSRKGRTQEGKKAYLIETDDNEKAADSVLISISTSKGSIMFRIMKA